MGEYYYVTRPKPKERKLTLDDILFDLINEREFFRTNAKAAAVPTTTRTNCYDYPVVTRSQQLERDIFEDIIAMEKFYALHRDYDVFFDSSYDYERQFNIWCDVKKQMLKAGNYDQQEVERETKKRVEEAGFNYNPYYYSFFMPKKSGGLRRIDAPSDGLKDALSTLKRMFERFMNGNTYHAAAYAYIPKRCAYDVGKKMRDNKCRWFLKTDFSDFFGSVNIDFAMRQLSKIYPFSEYIYAYGKRGHDAIYNCLKLCFLDGRLPQGTPISPLLTNVLMIPLDYKISNMLMNGATKLTTFDDQKPELNYRLIYTRYADDIYIGSHNGFRWEPVLEYIRKVIEEESAPFIIKKEKTRYCSSAGRNWILGVMLNENNDLTVGHRRKKQIKAMISNFAMDFKNDKPWEPNDVQQVLGNIAYMESIEKDYAESLVKNLNNKFQLDIIQAMKDVAYH